MPIFEKNRSVWKNYLNVPQKYVKSLHGKKHEDKSLVILEIYKYYCICAIRNNNLCRCGIPFKCKVVERGGHVYFLWKDKLYQIDGRYGWVF